MGNLLFILIANSVSSVKDAAEFARVWGENCLMGRPAARSTILRVLLCLYKWYFPLLRNTRFFTLFHLIFHTTMSFIPFIRLLALYLSLDSALAVGNAMSNNLSLKCERVFFDRAPLTECQDALKMVPNDSSAVATVAGSIGIWKSGK